MQTLTMIHVKLQSTIHLEQEMATLEISQLVLTIQSNLDIQTVYSAMRHSVIIEHGLELVQTKTFL